MAESSSTAAAASTSNNGGILKSPVAAAFAHIVWDSSPALSTLKLTAQESALLRMAETNPMPYTLADSRDASMYARVLLKLLAEASSSNTDGPVASLAPDTVLSEAAAVALYQTDPLGIVVHYALSKLCEILDTLGNSNKTVASSASTTSSTSTSTTSVVTTASVFYVGKEGVLVDQWKALLRVLHKTGTGDFFAQKVASLSLVKLLICACPSIQQKNNTSNSSSRPIQFASAMEPLEAITAWIVSQLKNTSSNSNSNNSAGVAVCTPALKGLMEATETRALFCQSGGIKYLARQLKQSSSHKTMSISAPAAPTAAASAPDESAPTPTKKKYNVQQASVQQLYEMSFCFWILSFDVSHSAAICADFAKDGLPIAALVDLVSIAPREKVVRVALSALINLATCSNLTTAPPLDAKGFLSEMIACGLMKAMDHLKDRQFTDPDLVADVQALHKLLHENYKEMSRWEVYKNEVESGHLQWGSTHTEAFFKQNANMMEGSDGDFHLLKVLIALLAHPNNNEQVTAVACYDIGEFVRHYPNGRAIAKRLGAKELVMPLIEHENAELQRHALQCVSKIMVHNWEYVK